MTRLQRTELLLFIACFFAFAYFNQGGGWNQNARFAEVRAIVEQGRFAIDDYLVYKLDSAGQLQRLPVTQAEFTWENERKRLCWVSGAWDLTPIGDQPLGEAKEEPMIMACPTGDVGYVPTDGHFHPNKPPGTQLAAVPGYFLVYHLERALGINPDSWWTLGVNAWLTGVLSVGLASAFGCVFFFRLAREMAGGAVWPALLATLTLAFGTTFFPFSTLLFDHNLTASFFVFSFYSLRRAMSAQLAEGTGKRWMIPAAWAGLWAGLAVLTNYPAALGVIGLGLYAWLRGGVHFRRAIAFCAGGIVPAIILCLYSKACYGSAFKLSNDFQSPLFQDPEALFGMFKMPHAADEWWRVIWVAKVLFYAGFRGIFYFSPVLLMALAGLVLWWRKGDWGTASLCLGVFTLFYLMNTFFNGFHAGFSAGPRYLIPGLPFLALPLVAAYQRFFWVTAVLAVVSIGQNTLMTVTDAQNPTGIGSHARVDDGRDDATYNLVTDYAWPLFAHQAAKPLLNGQETYLATLSQDHTALKLAAENYLDPADRQSAEVRAKKLRQKSAEVKRDHETLSTIRGPVSVNPMGVFEGLLMYAFFEPDSEQCRWASFNVGEFLFPQSRWSLLPLFLVSGGCASLALSRSRTIDPGTRSTK